MCKLPVTKTYALYFYVEVRYTNRKEMIKDEYSTYGEIPIDVPRDRQATFDPQVIPKRTRDVSGIETAEEWQNRPLKKFYTFLFVDCLYVSSRKEMETKSCAVYVILEYDVNGVKDILGLWIGEAVSGLEERQGYSYQYTTEPDEPYLDMLTFQMTDLEDDDLPFQ